MRCYITLDRLIFLKYNFKEQVLRKFTTTSFLWYNFKVSIDKSYQMFVFKQIIFSSTIEFIFNIYIYSFYSNERWINLYFKTCFITWVESNDKQFKIKPCAQCIMHVPTNWMGNWILIITWTCLFLICIWTFFLFIDIYFLLSIMNFS